MTSSSDAEDIQRLRQELASRSKPATTTEPIEQAAGQGDSKVTQRAEAAYWRQRYERSRVRLGKLWVAYKDLEAELTLRRDELGHMAERRAAVILEEHADSELLAITAGDGLDILPPSSEQEIEAGGVARFPILLANRTEETVVFELAPGEVDEGWQLVLPVESLELEGRSSQKIHAVVRSRGEPTPGDVGSAHIVARAGDREPEELVLKAIVVVPDQEPVAEDDAPLLTSGQPAPDSRTEEEAAPGEPALGDSPDEDAAEAGDGQTVEDDPPDDPTT